MDHGRSIAACRSSERGTVVLGTAVIACIAVLLAAVASVGIGIAARLQAAAAADAAALAAAPVTFAPFGADGTPASEAARFAALNGTRLVACRCPIDRTWRKRTVTVVVARSLPVPLLGTVEVRASSRATFEPSALIPTPDDSSDGPVTGS